MRFALLLAGLPSLVSAQGPLQTALTWQQIKDKFEASNPTLKAAKLNIDESRAAEITAYLRPNPDFSVGFDQINPFTKQKQKFAAKPASKAVRARPVKAIKDAVA